MILATGVIEEWVAGPRIGYELVVILLGHQLRFQPRHSAVDASVLSGVDPQHRRPQVGYVLQWRAAAVEGYCRPQIRVSDGHQPHHAAAETETCGPNPVTLNLGLVLQKFDSGIAVVNYLVPGDAA